MGLEGGVDAPVAAIGPAVGTDSGMKLGIGKSDGNATTVDGLSSDALEITDELGPQGFVVGKVGKGLGKAGYPWPWGASRRTYPPLNF